MVRKAGGGIVARILDALPEKARRLVFAHWFDAGRRKSFYEKTAELLANGLTPGDILESLRRRAVSGRSGIRACLFEDILEKYNETGSLAEAVAAYVPDVDHVLVRAGEHSAKLEETLAFAAEISGKETLIRNMFMKATAYPLLVIVLVVGMISWFSASLFPMMEEFLPLDGWPVTAKAIYTAGAFVTAWWPVVAIFIIVGGTMVSLSFRKLTGSVRVFLDRFPPWSIYRLSMGSGWMLSVASIVESGLTPAEALNVIANEAKNNPWLLERTEAVLANMTEAGSIGEAMETGLGFPDQELCEDMADYAMSPRFGKIFARVGREWIGTGVLQMESQATLLNRVALAVILVIVVLVIQAVMELMIEISGIVGMGFQP